MRKAALIAVFGCTMFFLLRYLTPLHEMDDYVHESASLQAADFRLWSSCVAKGWIEAVRARLFPPVVDPAVEAAVDKAIEIGWVFDDRRGRDPKTLADMAQIVKAVRDLDARGGGK